MPLNINVPNDKSTLFRGGDHHALAQLTVHYSFAIESKLAAWSEITYHDRSRSLITLDRPRP